jgi:hypothetical protein
MKVTITEEFPNGDITCSSVAFDDNDKERNLEDDEDPESCKQINFNQCGLRALICFFGSPWCVIRRNM